MAVSKALEKPISDREMTEAMKYLKDRTAYRLNRIPNEFLKRGGNELQEHIKLLLNMTFRVKSSQEKIWEARIKWLHKGKSALNLNNYRGISIGYNIAPES